MNFIIFLYTHIKKSVIMYLIIFLEVIQMKKQILTLTLASALAASSAAFAEAKDVTVTLDGKDIVFDVAPQIMEDRTMVPLRAIFEALGVTVEWDEPTRTITSFKDDTIVIMQIDNNILFKGEEKIELDVAPVIVNDRTLVPLRAVSESFGLNVEWNEETYAVTITSVTEDVTVEGEISETPDGETSETDNTSEVDNTESTDDTTNEDVESENTTETDTEEATEDTKEESAEGTTSEEETAE